MLIAAADAAFPRDGVASDSPLFWRVMLRFPMMRVRRPPLLLLLLKAVLTGDEAVTVLAAVALPAFAFAMAVAVRTAPKTDRRCCLRECSGAFTIAARAPRVGDACAEHLLLPFMLLLLLWAPLAALPLADDDDDPSKEQLSKPGVRGVCGSVLLPVPLRAVSGREMLALPSPTVVAAAAAVASCGPPSTAGAGGTVGQIPVAAGVALSEPFGISAMAKEDNCCCCFE
jgi:hypothetical protein